MTRVSFLLTFAILFFACGKDETPVEATVITSASLSDFQPGKSISQFNVNLVTTPLSVPAGGDNVVYDYSNVAVKTQFSSSFLAPVANTSFSTATYMQTTIDTFGRGSTAAVGVAANYYFEITPAGWAALGKTIPQVVLSYPSIGGTLTYPAQTYALSSKLYNFKLPLNYRDTFGVTNVTAKYSFVANAPAFAVNNVPGEEVATNSSGYNVIGRGTLKLKGYADAIPVLLVKYSGTTKVNYFLGGAPAPAALLSVAGITDGAVTGYTTYEFYSPSLGFVGAMAVNSSNTVVTAAAFRRNF